MSTIALPLGTLAILTLLAAPAASQGPSTVAPPLGPAPTCPDEIRDQATGQCLTVSSTPTLGALLPYPGENNSFVVPSVIAGGADNAAPGTYASIGGGRENTAAGAYAVVGGGYLNSASGARSTVGGGFSSWASGDDSTVGGGGGNVAVGQGSTVGGGVSNRAYGTYGTVAGGAMNETVGGPGNTVGGGMENVAAGYGYSVVGGGYGNRAEQDMAPSDAGATVCGGRLNEALGRGTTVGGGSQNRAEASYATVIGGLQNVVDGVYGTVGGGAFNYVDDEKGVIGGGMYNSASGSAATIVGGFFNTASGNESTIGGGGNNVASGYASMVPGGRENLAAGDFSFAAGRRAKANHSGSFVWGDSTNVDKVSTAANQFNVFASGGTRIISNAAGTTGVSLAAGSGSWTTISDRDAKENFQPVDGEAVLELLAQVPISTWSYKGQGCGVRHMGPMAQDMYAAFGLGLGPTTIDTVDADGVALAAIQGLIEALERTDEEIAALRAELDGDAQGDG